MSNETAAIPAEIYYRAGFLEIQQADNGDTFTISFASEAPVRRYHGNEILSISGMDQDRVREGAVPLLWGHNPNEVLGVIEKVWTSGPKAYAQCRWASNEQAEARRTDVEEGITRNVSCGYKVLETLQKADSEDYTVTKWQLCEISLCSVPEDYSVGLNRSLSAFTINPANRNPAMTVTQSDPIQQERARITAIRALADAHGHREMADQLIADGTSLDEARASYLAELTRTQRPVAGSVDPLGFTERDQRQYSIIRAIRAATDNDWKDAGFERECHLELLKRTGRTSTKGVLVPMRDLQIRAPYQTSPAAQGGNLVAIELLAQNFIDLLRNRAMTIRLGARMLSGLQGNVAIPRQNSATTTYWVAENAAITQAEATFDQVLLAPKTIAARSQLSRLLLLQSSMDVEQFVRMDFAQVIALGLDRAVISGSGTGNEPRGILNQVGINSVALGTNGAAPTWDSIVRLETEVAADNADIGSLAYLTNSAVRGKLKTTLKSASSVSEFIWQDYPTNEGMGMVNGLNAGVSNQCPAT
ncbi:MAG: phage major capsid protein [Acaryochloridaceae cyanobacterium SU_2_1]|nr:phage major capsid protein [Acaryochloridaceae cyanobacterium SU_2_1]